MGCHAPRRPPVAGSDCTPPGGKECGEPVCIGTIDEKSKGNHQPCAIEREVRPDESNDDQEGTVHNTLQVTGEAHARVRQRGHREAGEKAQQKQQDTQAHECPVETGALNVRFQEGAPSFPHASERGAGGQGPGAFIKSCKRKKTARDFSRAVLCSV